MTPKLINTTPDLTDLKERCVDFLEMMEGDYHEDRIEKYTNAIYEAALTALYGEDIWEWVNERIV